MNARIGLILAAAIALPLALSACGSDYYSTPTSAYDRSDVVFGIQTDLQRRGYDVGPADGVYGPRTSAAIRSYQWRNGLVVDGSPSVTLLDYMRSHPVG